MLSAKQQQFCEQYLLDLNATQAAIRAGYSETSARQIAAKNMSKDDILARIQELQNERSSRTLVTADYVVTGLKDVAERCMQRVPVMVFNPVDKCMEQKQDEDGNGVWMFDSTGANRALELLGKHLGIFEKDNNQQQTVITVNVQD